MKKTLLFAAVLLAAFSFNAFADDAKVTTTPAAEAATPAAEAATPAKATVVTKHHKATHKKATTAMASAPERDVAGDNSNAINTSTSAVKT